MTGWRSGVVAACLMTSSLTSANPLEYPESKRLDLVETLHGVSVPDPYRWLEEMESPDVKAWVEAQNKLTFGYLGAIPERDAVRERVRELINFERYSVPVQEAGKLFFTRNDGLQPQAVLYVQDSATAEPRVLLDPNKLSQDGTVALSGWSVSDDGRHLAYSVSSGGSDWQTWRVRDVATGEDLPDLVQWSKFSGASWDKEGKGFYYSRYDAPKEGEALSGQNFFQKLYYHRLGTPQSQDVLIYERKDQKEWGFAGEVSEDGRYLVITVWQGTARENRVFVKDLRDSKQSVRELLDKAHASYGYVGNIGTRFYFFTDKDAPMGKLIAIDLRQPDPKAWQTVIRERKERLGGVSLVGDRLVAQYLKDAHSSVEVMDRAGRLVRRVDLPGLGTAFGFGGERADKETYYAYTSYTSPTTIYRYDIARGTSEVWRQAKTAFDGSAFETKQIFFTSKDGTRVPMFVTHRKGLELNGQNPTLIYGYGGFQGVETPGYSTSWASWLELGGVLAVVNLRGGAEYGNAWHDAGRLHNKQNTFDDFIGAAEYLQREKFTSPAKTAILGGSNGGLLVGAVLTQRPELYGAALPEVGVLDMLRFHKFTIGWAWVSDYGSPDKKDDFDVLLRYSPYHNVKKGTKYPATLITTGDHDDRVVPMHSYKFAAALQWAQGGEAPVLIRVETRAGHGAGKPIDKVIEETADQWAFLIKNLGMALPEGYGK